MVNINSLERDGLRQAELCPRHTMKMKTKNTPIPDRSQPGITMTAPTVRHRDVGDKYATGVPKTSSIVQIIFHFNSLRSKDIFRTITKFY